MTLLWDSGTNDQEGSDQTFAVMPLSESYAPGTLQSVGSVNGRYMLLVYADRVDLVYNPFNMPRYTSYVLTPTNGTNLGRAEQAQSNFCIQALNNTSVSQLKFVDNHCACLRNEIMASRVFPAIRTLGLDSQVLLERRTPCVLKDCQLNPVDEYTVSNLSVGNDCKEGLGVCGQFAPNLDSNLNLFLIQDCGNIVNPCLNSGQCPAGSICRNGQCVPSCTNDSMCKLIDPFAVCIQGQCQIQNQQNASGNNSSSSSGTWSPWTIVLAVIFGVMALSLLLALTYLVVRKQTQEREDREEDD